MDRVAPTVVVVVVLLGIVALMWRSWRARTRRDAGLAAGHPGTGADAPVIASAPVLYVATTPRARPLERLAIRGLGFRARARLTVTAAGVDLSLAGEEPVFIPAAAIELLTPATMTIDRVVETDGLLLLGWRLHRPENAPAPKPGEDISVDSYFRIPDPIDRDRITDAIRSIAADATGPAARDESEA
ncbi:hypothetical protein [Cryobacterium tagatosivorans]|uniref:PH domain-containing protein n=1 Tax=Cryobacterium tagatosivorans TaxID=1259199 RepID=A0A4R8UJ70_9MICO|nr:hypothetical protein [Cryobacterium tagatosivorans]TFB55590.1 hypothetical protein E3O23_02200 [Cryobacterium tagatosivorans]